MDPSIMKLLEEDEDETMHSGADVEAFTAALNRDIEGDISTSQPSDSDSNALSQGSSHASSQFLPQWQTSNHDDNANSLSQQDPLGSQKSEPLSAEMDVKQPGLVHENQKQQDNTMQEVNIFSVQNKPSQDNLHPPQAEQKMVPISQEINMQDAYTNVVHNTGPERTQNPDHDAQLVNLQKANNQQASFSAMSNQQAVVSTMTNQQPKAPGTSNQQASNALNRGKQVPFALLLPVIQPQLDKDRAMQLNTLYLKLRKNEISKDGFVRHMRSIVGDQMLKMAVYKLQSQAARNTQNVPSQVPSQSQVSTQQQNLPTSSTVAMTTDSTNKVSDSNAQKPREVERLPDSHGVPLSQMSTASLAANQDKERSAFPPQGINKQHSQHMLFSHPSFPTYGNTGSIHRPYSTMNTNTSTPLKQLPHDSQMRPIPAHQTMNATQLGTTTQGMNMVSVTKFDGQNSFNDPKRLQSGSLTPATNSPVLPQNSVQWQSLSAKEQKSGIPSSTTFVKPEPLDQSNEQYKSQFSATQGLSSFPSTNVEQGNTLPGTLKDETFEMQSSRLGFSAPTSTVPTNPMLSSMPSQMEPNNTLNSRMHSSTSASMGIGTSSKAPAKKPSIGQKKPQEALGSSPPPSSKKQKVSGAFLDQSIEQLNDVTAVSGVNLREEEEQLFSGPKEDSRVSEASRRVVQEEEDRLILEKIPLKRKLAEILAKCGLKGISNDVERCLSLCVEERMRGLVGNLIRLSKQRLDIEKSRHKTVVTSDVHQQIMLINRKAREEWEKKQAEVEKQQKLNEPESNPGVDGEKEKDEGRVKPANKEEDDKMRTTAANVAARAAVGGDDMLSKWQLMAEQARQKREGGIDAASGSQPGKDTGRKPSSGRSSRDNQEVEKRGQSAANSTPGAARKVGRNQVVVTQPKVARTISVKDVIAVLEREPQMSKSTLMYRLYERIRSDANDK
ncbi:transcription initiation factor TFIID subunit 4b-like isoform X2 [Coffea arabica]|uniref:Transcription initiation factor TFIID subunit 4b-like isoform X2 n=1 Tax=Coffea arabica TaxID=13443 RepID=A0ABM4VZM3_COFAR